mmetsp:Transcript_3926/g.11348  ORF Transcript_3926/g.11348 Transcript_3926/m.11348 type:complete len:236 (-) Transcript_3926:290-997(-)
MRISAMASSSWLPKNEASDSSYGTASSLQTCTIPETFSQNQVQASSCIVLQIFGSDERKAASMQALNCLRSTVPSGNLDSRRARTQLSSLMRSEFFTFITKLSHDSITISIHAMVFLATPMTAALMLNISEKEVGRALFAADLSFASFFFPSAPNSIEALDWGLVGSAADFVGLSRKDSPLPALPLTPLGSESASVETPELSLVLDFLSSGFCAPPASLPLTMVQLSISVSSLLA